MGTRSTPKRIILDYPKGGNGTAHGQRLARNNPTPKDARLIAMVGQQSRGWSDVPGKDREPLDRPYVALRAEYGSVENLVRDRAATRRPIQPEEVAGLEAMGGDIRFRRRQAGLNLNQLARLADRDPSFLGKIERATRRPRLDTLEAIARALHMAGAGNAEELLASWCAMAGESIAPLSAWPGWADKLQKKRAKRERRRQRDLERRANR